MKSGTFKGLEYIDNVHIPIPLVLHYLYWTKYLIGLMITYCTINSLMNEYILKGNSTIWWRTNLMDKLYTKIYLSSKSCLIERINRSDTNFHNFMQENFWSKSCAIWWMKLSDQKMPNFLMKLSDKKLQNLMNEHIWLKIAKFDK